MPLLDITLVPVHAIAIYWCVVVLVSGLSTESPAIRLSWNNVGKTAFTSLLLLLLDRYYALVLHQDVTWHLIPVALAGLGLVLKNSFAAPLSRRVPSLLRAAPRAIGLLDLVIVGCLILF
jgi:hypothetical protein